jgi:hypothetical protein
MEELLQKRRRLLYRYYELTRDQEKKILSRDLPGLEALLSAKDGLIREIDELNRQLAGHEDDALHRIIGRIIELEQRNMDRSGEQLDRIRQEMVEMKYRKRCISSYIK